MNALVVPPDAAAIEGSAAADPPPLVAIGASGSEGLQQIAVLLSALPRDLPAVVLAVLHRPPDKPSWLRDVLQRRSSLPVRVATPGEPLQPGVCYIGEPARHLALSLGDHAAVVPDHRYRNRTVDLLFETAAVMAGARTIGVILDGSLSDGAMGLAAICKAGGRALVLDPAAARHAGMANAALQAAPDAETQESPAAIAGRIVALLGYGREPAQRGRR